MNKIRKITAAVAAIALTAAFSSCSGDTADNSGEADITESIEAVTTSETEETTTGETVSVTVISNLGEEETEQTTETNEEVSDIVLDEEENVQVSSVSEFIDFEFIEDYQGTTDIGDLADKAIAFMKESEQYKRSADSVESFTLEGMLKNTEYTSEYAEIYSEEFSKYISNGVIEPQISAAYPDDYDGDGTTETFIIIKMPYSPPHLRDGIVTVRDFVVFADKDGNMEIIDETSDMYPVQLLNYGSFKHIAIGGGGMAGVEDHTALYGVLNGKLVRYYSDRCSFAKEDCFLSAFGWQGVGDFMYFDTAAQEYCVIMGVEMDIEAVKAMDTSDSLAVDDFLFCQLIGGKYYCFMAGMMDWGTIYTYDNGSFTLIEDSKVRKSDNICELPTVVDIDIEQALADMKPVEN